jgi:hypothetical protein
MSSPARGPWIGPPAAGRGHLGPPVSRHRAARLLVAMAHCSLATAVLLTTTFEALRSLSRYARVIETVSGVFLVVMGAALLFDLVYRLDAWILQAFPVRPAL